jgi:glycosyltransferase involved in cell wall biosynthesis
MSANLTSHSPELGHQPDKMEAHTITLVAHGIHDDGGMERAFAELIRRMASRYRVLVVSSELAPSLRPLVEWRRVPVPRRPFPLRLLMFFLLGGMRLRGARSDLIHTLGAIVPNRSDLAQIQFCHAGFVAATNHLGPAEAPRLRRLNTSMARLLSLGLERWSYRPGRLRRFLAVSDGVATELKRHYPGIPVTVASNGVDLERYKPDSAARSQMRASEGVPADAVIALFVGGDWDRKGLPIILRAVAGAGEMLLWVIGSGDKDRFEGLARELGITDRIRLFGSRSDGERFYAAADIFCVASSYETFSIATHEAAASGLPIVASPVSGVTELMGDDQAGFLVERTVEGFRHALVRLAANPALRARLGSAGRQRVGQFTWDASAAAVLDVYREILNGAAAGSQV